MEEGKSVLSDRFARRASFRQAGLEQRTAVWSHVWPEAAVKSDDHRKGAISDHRQLIH